jgi:hypothetical protein
MVSNEATKYSIEYLYYEDPLRAFRRNYSRILERIILPSFSENVQNHILNSPTWAYLLMLALIFEKALLSNPPLAKYHSERAERSRRKARLVLTLSKDQFCFRRSGRDRTDPATHVCAKIRMTER